tara:strand:+ start:114 stop:500 length:387 start_codon:yes stop_codon:yes gene_type:complete
MSSNLNVDDFVLTMDKNKMQIGGYNIENSLSGTPLFKTYSNGEKSVTIPAGLYLLNNQNLHEQTGGYENNEELYFKKNDNLLVEQSLFNKLEELASINKSKQYHSKTQKAGKKNLKLKLKLRKTSKKH